MNPEQVVAAALFLLLASATALSTAALASLSELMLFSRSSAFSPRAEIWALFAVVVGAAVVVVVVGIAVVLAGAAFGWNKVRPKV